MLFLHIVDDYYLQGVLAKLKQKSWWEENAPNDLYKHDYIIALIEHAFSWTFMISLPAIVYMLYTNDYGKIIRFGFLFLINWVIHGIVDDLKANKMRIDLITDQLIHILQVVVMFIFMFYIERK